MAKQMTDAEAAHAYRLLQAQKLIEAYWTAHQQQRARDKALHETRVAMARKEAGTGEQK
jgi:hypothetical protein